MEVKLASLDEVCEGISEIVPLLKRYKNRLDADDFVHDRMSGNGPVVDNLINNLSRQFPEAGRIYWSVRGWSLLVWQPVYVTILAANIWNTHIELASMGQRVRGTIVAGFYLPEHDITIGYASDPLHSGAQTINDLVTKIYDKYGVLLGIRRKLAFSIASDIMLDALMTAGYAGSMELMVQLPDLGQKWLHAAKLKTRARLVHKQGNNSLHIEPARNACCQAFRCSGGQLCESCPRRKKSI